jgi:hypothetical protein
MRQEVVASSLTSIPLRSMMDSKFMPIPKRAVNPFLPMGLFFLTLIVHRVSHLCLATSKALKFTCNSQISRRLIKQLKSLRKMKRNKRRASSAD